MATPDPMEEMDAWLGMLGAVHRIGDILEKTKQELVGRGWSEVMAEQAAIVTVGQMIGKYEQERKRP